MFIRTIAIALAAFAALLSFGPAQAAPDIACTRYEPVGTGPDVILVPGLGSSPAVWDGTIAALSDRFRFHRVAVPGFAGEPPEEAIDERLPQDIPSRTAQRIADYIACRGLDRPAIVGHSMGGLTGLIVASEHPDSIGRLVVIDALPFYPLIFDSAATEHSVAPQAAAIAQTIRSADDASFAQMQMRAAASLAQSPDHAAMIADWTLASDRETFASAMQSVMTSDLRPALPGIAIPVTIVYATNHVATPDRARTLYESAYSSLPDVKFVPIAESYHFTMLDQPETTMRAIEEALKAK